MKIILDEKDVFTYNKKELEINIYRHPDERYTGIPNFISNIKFFDLEQVFQFKEMLEFILEDNNENT